MVVTAMLLRRTDRPHPRRYAERARSAAAATSSSSLDLDPPLGRHRTVGVPAVGGATAAEPAAPPVGGHSAMSFSDRKKARAFFISSIGSGTASSSSSRTSAPGVESYRDDQSYQSTAPVPSVTMYSRFDSWIESSIGIPAGIGPLASFQWAIATRSERGATTSTGSPP